MFPIFRERDGVVVDPPKDLNEWLETTDEVLNKEI